MGTGYTFSFNPAELRSDSASNYELIHMLPAAGDCRQQRHVARLFLKVQLIFIITDGISKLIHDVATTGDTKGDRNNVQVQKICQMAYQMY